MPIRHTPPQVKGYIVKEPDWNRDHTLPNEAELAAILNGRYVQGQILSSKGTTDISTVSLVPVDIPDMSVAIVTTGGKVKIEFSGAFLLAAGNPIAYMYFRLLRDATVLAGGLHGVQNVVSPYYIAGHPNITWLDELVAGNYTYKAQWWCGAGTIFNFVAAAPNNYHRILIVTEYIGM